MQQAFCCLVRWFVIIANFGAADLVLDGAFLRVSHESLRSERIRPGTPGLVAIYSTQVF